MRIRNHVTPAPCLCWRELDRRAFTSRWPSPGSAPSDRRQRVWTPHPASDGTLDFSCRIALQTVMVPQAKKHAKDSLTIRNPEDSPGAALGRRQPKYRPTEPIVSLGRCLPSASSTRFGSRTLVPASQDERTTDTGRCSSEERLPCCGRVTPRQGYNQLRLSHPDRRAKLGTVLTGVYTTVGYRDPAADAFGSESIEAVLSRSRSPLRSGNHRDDTPRARQSAGRLLKRG